MFEFHVLAGEFCKAARPGTRPNSHGFSFCIQVQETQLLVDLMMTCNCKTDHDYDIHAVHPVSVQKYMCGSGHHCRDPRLIGILDRVEFDSLYERLHQLKPESVIRIQLFADNTDQLFDKLRVVVQDDNVTAALPQITVEEYEDIVPQPDHYDVENPEADLWYKSATPTEIMFYSVRAPGFWLAVELVNEGSVSELNQVRGFVEVDASTPATGDTYIMPKARRGRKQATIPESSAAPKVETPSQPPAPPVEPPPVEPPPVEPPPVEPPPVTPPPVEPSAPPVTPPPVEPPPAPQAVEKPPVDPQAGTQETEPSKKKSKGRRSKEEIRQDSLDEAFRVLTEEQGAEDVIDKLEEFCRGVLQSRGFSVERTTTDEALTLKEKLGAAADSIDSVVGKLAQIKDQVRAAQASSDGLCSKEELIAKLAQSL
jgi:hypothetical protein